MNKAELIEAVSKDLQVSRAEAERSINTVVENIKKGVKKDKLVQLIGFGTFAMRQRKARTGRNPQTGAEIKIKASRSVAFKPGKSFKSEL